VYECVCTNAGVRGCVWVYSVDALSALLHSVGAHILISVSSGLVGALSHILNIQFVRAVSSDIFVIKSGHISPPPHPLPHP